MDWTKEQQQVIDLSGRDILVSAAAGSGKTAVLVERIIKKITSETQPVDIDRLLVVTFTNAAAAEMRERIRIAIDKCLLEKPSDENLARQASLIHNSQITTIDSFCLFVVRNHFGEIALEPSFRIADNGELELLKIDTLSKLLEEEYEKNRTENGSIFLQFVDTYSDKRTDAKIKDMILNLYRQSESKPWPIEWLEELAKEYQVEAVEELEQSAYMQDICAYTKQIAADCMEQTKTLLSVALEVDGPQKYEQALLSDIVFYQSVLAKENYNELYELLSNYKYASLAAIRNFTGNEQKKIAVSEGRKALKSTMEELSKKYFAEKPEEVIYQLAQIRPYVEELIRLTCLLHEKMAAAKRKKKIVDFSDIEHFALNILVDEKTKELRPTAKELENQFEEVMIDEYQDSNEVQETILKAVAKNGSGGHNMFMVGDVKQSIYRFRMACPELFMDKYAKFSIEESDTQKIELHKNFRSRIEVIHFVNDMCFKLMGQDLGDVGYDESAALYYGADFPNNEGTEAEIMYFDLETVEEESDLTKRQLEAHMVADKIHSLMETFWVMDKETKQLRKLKYSDIVILFRTMKGWGEDFASVLAECGIPAHVESQTGYFSAIEVQTVLNMLRILDNPYQDIPMAAVLHSPIVGLDDEELAEIRKGDDKLPFAAVALLRMKQAVCDMQNKTHELSEMELRLANFYQIYESLRAAKDITIRDLIYRVLKETGYMDYAAALPAGQKRAANLEMLLEKAAAYEKTSYKGLFHFVRYVDQIKKYEIDAGEADIIGENADVVHIMTIHKSKGLEYPVVFVSGLSKQFNLRDTSDVMVAHAKLGIGLNQITGRPKRKRQNLLRTQIAEQIKLESIGEELRVLYVALTRAKEKLILTGAMKASDISKYTGNVVPKQTISFLARSKAKSYTDWIIPAVLSYPDKYEVQFVSEKELIALEIEEQAHKKERLDELFSSIEKADKNEIERINSCFSYQYPYESEKNIKSKYSVSELKHLAMEARFKDEDGEAARPEFLQEKRKSYIPSFANVKVEDEEDFESPIYGVSKGALRGTAVHRVMECLDFVKLSDVDRTDRAKVKRFVKEELERMKKDGELSEEMHKLIYPSMIEGFVLNEVAGRMAKAAAAGKLYKEKPFVMEHEKALVQGIIDVFWEEEDGLVVLDYKTDRIEQSIELLNRYQTQLMLYAKALERIFSTKKEERKTKEALLYSFRLQEVVRV